MSAAAVRTATSWPAVAAAIGAGVIAATYVGKMAPALPGLQQDFGLSLVAAGWLVSIFNTIAVIGALFLGLLADRVGALRLAMSGLALLALGAAAGALAGSPSVVLASRVIEGIGFVSVTVSAPGLVSAATVPAQRGLSLGFWSSYMPVGAGLVVLVAAGLLPFTGWRNLWWLVCAAALVAMALLWRARGEYAASRGAPRTLAQVKGAIAQPVPWLLGAAFGMYTFQWHAIMVWLPSYLKANYALGTTTMALLTVAYIVANVPGNSTGGWLVHRGVPRGRIIAAAFALTSLIFVGIFSEALPPLVRYLLVLIYSAVTGVVAAAALTGSARYARSPAEAGSIQGLLVQLSQAGVFLSPITVAWVVTLAGSWQAARWVMLAAGAGGIAIGLAILRFERAEQASGAAPART